MSYEIKPGSALGRLGEGFGKGLSEQLPKEIERYRLSSGLKQFEQESGNLNPLQQLARLSSIPGITPQMIQSFGELAKQQNKANALTQMQGKDNQPKEFPFPGRDQNKSKGSEIPSITKEQPLSEIQEGFIPPTQEEIYNEAGRMYNDNPAFFENNPQKAIEAAENAALRKQTRNEAFQKQHENLTKIQDNVVNRLRKHSEGLGVDIPPDTYSKIEDEAIKATKPKNQGGGGLTEQQSMKEYGKKLDEVSRQYKDLDSLSTIYPPEMDRRLKSLQKEFSERGDSRNLALSLIDKLNISPMKAYSKASPVKNNSELSRIFKKIPTKKPGYSGFNVDTYYSDLKNAMGTKESPLSIANELYQRGHDPRDWLNYLSDHKKDLTGEQIDQLSKNVDVYNTLPDIWLNLWGG